MTRPGPSVEYFIRPMIVGKGAGLFPLRLQHKKSDEQEESSLHTFCVFLFRAGADSEAHEVFSIDNNIE
jgi:hypothetical protein